MPVRYAGEHVRADTVSEALGYLADDTDTQVLAGGYSLMPELKDGISTPSRLVDISGVDSLTGITRGAGETVISALSTHADVAASAVVRENARALAEATDSVGDYQAKHRGTIGGNLVFADRKYDAPGAFLALGGEVAVRSEDGSRTVGADEWFDGADAPTLGSGELVTEVVVPDADRSGYVRTSEYSGYAVVSVAAALETEGRTVTDARLATNGAKPYPVRLPAVEERLVGEPVSDLPESAADAALRDTDLDSLVSDGPVGGRYRRRLVRSYCRRALEDATTA